MKTIPRILFVDHAEGLGGAEHSLLMLMSHLTPGKWEPHLAGTNGRFLSAAEQANIPIYPVALPRLRRSPRFPFDWLAGARAIAAAAHQVNAEFLHANTIRAALYTALAAKIAKRPFIWHMRDFWLSEDKPAHLWLDKNGKQAFIASAKYIIANSNAVANHLPASKKISVIHNGIDTTQFDPKMDGTPFRQQVGIPPKVPLVGMMGRLRPWKGQSRFLQMAEKIIETNPTTWFVIVGGTVFSENDAYLHQLQQMSHTLGIAERVVFTGQLQNIKPALAALDVFVHPGDPEPFGLVNIEAMAMSKPVVAFAHGALPEIVTPNETGLLVMPGDISALATAVSTLLINKKLAQRLGTAGRNRASQQFDITRTAKEFETLLSKE